MNIVVVDSGRLAGEPDFPEVDCPKFGWLQFVELDPAGLIEACWRADIVVSVSTPIDKAVLDEAFKLRLIVVAGEEAGHIDFKTAGSRGIEVCNAPGLNPDDPAQSQQICNQVIANIDAFLKGDVLNRVVPNEV